MAKIQFVCIPATVYGLLVYLLYKSLDEYVKLTNESLFDNIKEIHNISKLTDLVVSLLPLSHNRKLKYLKEISAVKRLKMLLDDLEYAHYAVDRVYDVDAMVWTSVEYCLGDFVDNYNYLIDYDEE